ncbi:hypothetical protein D3C79_1087660 [compost metagenome]
MLLEQRARHAVMGVEVDRSGLDGPDDPKRTEQGGGKARLANRVGHLGNVLEPLF